MISGTTLRESLERALDGAGVDYRAVVADFGQVAAYQRRAAGVRFALRDHVKGLVLAQLSNQRTWGPIARNLEAISAVFLGYDPEQLTRADPNELARGLAQLRCGNRAIGRQMKALAGNISTLRAIEGDFASLDSFVTHAKPHEVARKLAVSGTYKLHQVGFALALEYLRNVGIPAIKPDLHVRRALSGVRLGLADGHPSEMEAYEILMRLAEASRTNPTYLDNLLWLFCAQDYGDICGDTPRCELCTMTAVCNYPEGRSHLSGP